LSRSIEIFKTTGDKDVDEFVKSAAISNSQFVLFTIRIEVRTRQNITTSSISSPPPLHLPLFRGQKTRGFPFLAGGKSRNSLTFCGRKTKPLPAGFPLF
jgi:hypothetical protein